MLMRKSKPKENAAKVDYSAAAGLSCLRAGSLGGLDFILSCVHLALTAGDYRTAPNSLWGVIRLKGGSSGCDGETLPG